MNVPFALIYTMAHESYEFRVYYVLLSVVVIVIRKIDQKLLIFASSLNRDEWRIPDFLAWLLDQGRTCPHAAKFKVFLGARASVRLLRVVVHRRYHRHHHKQQLLA